MSQIPTHRARRLSKKTVALVAGGVFLLSHFLPAYGGTGFGCFAFCWGAMIEFEKAEHFGRWLYYSGFALSNPLFLSLVLALLMMKRWPRVRYYLTLVLSLHVLSWLFICLYHERNILPTLGLGYFVWLTAYLLLFCAHNLK